MSLYMRAIFHLFILCQGANNQELPLSRKFCQCGILTVREAMYERSNVVPRAKLEDALGKRL